MGHKKPNPPTKGQKPYNPEAVMVAASMAQAAGLLGIALPAVQEAKRAGCPAFRGNGTVPMSTLSAWLAKHKPAPTTGESKAEANRREAIARANEREIRVDERRRNLIPDYIMRRSFTRSIVAAKTRLLAIADGRSQLYATKTDAIEIREGLRREINEALAELTKCEWSKDE